MDSKDRQSNADFSSPPRTGASEQVRRFSIEVACTDPSCEAAQRPRQRAEVLARWLVAAWEREHQGGG